VKLTEEQIRRYSRHIILPEVGGRGQRRILEASVVLGGLGAAGSVAAMYLAAAGVGRITLWDPAPVTEADLAAAVAYTVDKVGQNRAAAAAEVLRAINPDVTVQVAASEAEAGAGIEPGGVVLLSAGEWRPLHDRAIREGARVVACGVHGAEGAFTVLQPGGPCLACLPPAVLQEAGLWPEEPENPPLAPVAGVVGLGAATEVIKLILGVGVPLAGRLLRYEGWSASFRDQSLAVSGGCPVCGA